MPWPETETELAAPVVAWFVENGYEVFQEVERHQRVADIVARKDGLIWVVEVKRSLSFAVVDQARYWRHWAHKVSVAVPRGKRRGGRETALDTLKMLGIGMLEVRGPGWCEPVIASLTPVHNMLANGAGWKLVEAQKDFCAAGSSGGYWTKFKQTLINLQAFVTENPGCSLNKAIENIKHHYSTPASARSQLLKMSEKGVIKAIRFVRNDKAICLFSTENTAP